MKLHSRQIVASDSGGDGAAIVGRRQNISTVSFSMFKSTRISENVSFRLEAQVYNLLNHRFLGVPDPFIDDGNLANGGTFGNNFSNPSGGDYTNVGPTGLGRRRMVLGLKAIF